MASSNPPLVFLNTTFQNHRKHVLALISGVLQAKPNEAPEAAAHTDFGLGIKSRMVGESTEMMVMEYDIFFMF